jgi:hypothetical protein
MNGEYLSDQDKIRLTPLWESIDADDLEGVRRFFEQNRTLIHKKYRPDYPASVLWRQMRSFATVGKFDFLKLCVEFGGEVNGYLDDDHHGAEGILAYAAGNRNLEMLRWLLHQGAIFQQVKDGQTFSYTLLAEARTGHLEGVRLLIERGAPVNGLAPNRPSALDLAVSHGHPEVAELLRAHGAKHDWEILGEPPPQPRAKPTTLRAHLDATLPLREIEVVGEFAVSPGRSIRLLRADTNQAQILVTEGMSDAKPTALPEGSSASFEAYFLLPEVWPLTAEALDDPRYGWPARWLLRIAREAFEGRFPKELPASFLSDEPPALLAPNTPMSSLLATQTSEPWAVWERANGTRVELIYLCPVHATERTWAETHGIRALLEVFDEALAPRIVVPDRADLTNG